MYAVTVKVEVQELLPSIDIIEQDKLSEISTGENCKDYRRWCKRSLSQNRLASSGDLVLQCKTLNNVPGVSLLLEATSLTTDYQGITISSEPKVIGDLNFDFSWYS